MSRRFVALDGLRGVAAAAVAIHHLRNVFGVDIRVPNGPLAVDFFFMLSGFVLAHRYSESLMRGEFCPYLVSRAVRLFPLIVFAAVLAAAVHIALRGQPALIMRLAAMEALSIPYLGHAAFSRDIMPLQGPAWSLFFELVASLAFGLGLWRGRWANLAVIGGAGCFVAAILMMGRVTVGYDQATFLDGFAGRCCGGGPDGGEAGPGHPPG